MTDSEKEIQFTFKHYSEGRFAKCMMVPVPNIVIRKGPKVFCVPSAKAPYDLIGYHLPDARFIGAEIKENDAEKTSLPIIGPAKKGTGLQYHQLDALYDVASDGGIARLLWRNAGAWGVMREAGIINTKDSYDTAVRSEAWGSGRMLGFKSISWDMFEPIPMVEIGGVSILDWLLTGKLQ